MPTPRLVARFALVVVVAVMMPWAFPSIAAAEDVPPVSFTLPSPPKTSRPHALVPLYVSLGVLQGLDGHSTLRAVSHGGRELNPVVNGLKTEPILLFTAKAAGTAGVVYFSERLWRNHHRVAAVLTMVAVNSAYSIIVANNYSHRR